MPRTPEKVRFVPPIMHAFRAAFQERDSARPIDRKNEDGERIIAGRRATPRSSVNEAVLRQELAEDLSALLNTVNLAAAQDLTGLDRVAGSILNFGVTDLTAIATNSRAADDLSGALASKLEHYESRLIPGTVRIRNEESRDDASGQLRFHITAEMYSTPVDVAVEFVAEIETDSGKMKLTRL